MCGPHRAGCDSHLQDKAHRRRERCRRWCPHPGARVWRHKFLPLQFVPRTWLSCGHNAARQQGRPPGALLRAPRSRVLQAAHPCVCVFALDTPLRIIGVVVNWSLEAGAGVQVTLLCVREMALPCCMDGQQLQQNRFLLLVIPCLCGSSMSCQYVLSMAQG